MYALAPAAPANAPGGGVADDDDDIGPDDDDDDDAVLRAGGCGDCGLMRYSGPPALVPALVPAAFRPGLPPSDGACGCGGVPPLPAAAVRGLSAGNLPAPVMRLSAIRPAAERGLTPLLIVVTGASPPPVLSGRRRGGVDVPCAVAD